MVVLKIIYNSINGRGEFNFTNKYTTGCTVSDKSLKLISKYRCDSYGIEFMAQKRGAESTDNESDTDVFFVLCKKQGIALVPMRSVSIILTSIKSERHLLSIAFDEVNSMIPQDIKGVFM